MRYDILRKELFLYERRSLAANSILFVGYDVGIEMLTFLLEHGINPNEQDNIGNVVLNYATAENDIFAIETLIKFGGGCFYSTRLYKFLLENITLAMYIMLLRDCGLI